MSVASSPSALARFRSSSLRQAAELALAGAFGALFGLKFYTDLIQANNVYVRDAWAGMAIGGTIGFFLNAAGPLREGAWLKLARKATWGALAGALGGAIGLPIGELVGGWFQGGLAGRSLAWAILGLGIGISQGLAERSRQRLVFGVLGGTIGGLVGGLLFEALKRAMGNRNTLSQGIGIVIVGAGLGLFLALVEQALRRAWVQVQSGRQEGRVYLLARKKSVLGLDERAEVGIFGDPQVVRCHAEVESTPQGYILHNHAPSGRTRVNGKVVGASEALHDGDRIEVGQTRLVFRQR